MAVELYEIQDGGRYGLHELSENLNDIARFNRLFGVYYQVVTSIESVIRHYSLSRVSILDVGTGVADIPRAIVRQFEVRGIPVSVTAIDSNPATVRLARQATRDIPSISVRAVGANDLEHVQTPDIVLCHQTFHHLPLDERPELLQRLHNFARYSLVMHDLARSRTAFWLTKGFIRAMTKNRLSRFDGPQSVLRSLNETEMLSLAARAGIRHFSWRRLFPFRWALITYH